MQSGRNNRLDGRVPIPINRTGYGTKIARNVDIEKRKQQLQMPQQRDEPVGKPVGASIINIPEDGKVGKPRKIPVVSNVSTKPKTKVTEVNRVSQSIQKLLSEFEGVDKGKPKIGEERKVKPIRQAADKPTVRRVSPVLSEKAKVYSGKTMRNSEGEFPPQRRNPQRKKPMQEEEKFPVESINDSMIVSTVSLEKKNSQDVTSSTDQLIPIMTPERHVEKSVNLINSIITNYLEEKPEERPLDFLLAGCEAAGSVFPVCSKRATDDIPSTEMATVVPDGRIPDKSDLIIMLRRRNSEPYPPRNCLLQGATESENERVWPGLNSVDNYYLWESRPTQPYWEVSLFKSNRSLSVLTSRAASGMLSLTQGSDSSEMLQPGRFSPRRKVEVDAKPSWLREITSISDNQVDTVPFVTLMEKGRVIPREPEVKPKRERPTSGNRLPRILSKDDHYKPPGHLLVYVKSSQKKLVSADGSDRRPEHPINKKIHRITKIRCVNSETTSSSLSVATLWHKKILVTATSALFLVIGAFLLLLYFLTRRHSFSNLTPPIPGLVRGC